LAASIGVPAETLSATIERYNEQVAAGVDEDLGRFDLASSFKPEAIDKAPFYAAPFFPITRKSMGGIAVDEEAHVLRADGTPIENLYSVGEATGFAGINGSAALEGTFLGPGAYMGRVVGRKIAGGESAGEPSDLAPAPTQASGPDHANSVCFACHQLEADIDTARPGFWHFEQSHAKVLSRGYKCVRCHTGKLPFDPVTHKLDRLAQTLNCVACHASATERAAFR